jgi:hypothetical protein
MPPWIKLAAVALAITAPGSTPAQGVSATIAPLRDSVGDGGPATAAHADSLSVDPGRIGVVAFSDAAPLLTDLIRQAPAHVKALAAFSPHLDLRRGPPPFWMEDDSLTRARYSPMVELERGQASRPLLLLVGSKGDAVETSAAAVEIVRHPDGGHDFDRDALTTWLDFLGRHLR